MKIVIPDELKRQFKKACIDADSNMSEIVCILVEKWLTERGVISASPENDSKSG